MRKEIVETILRALNDAGIRYLVADGLAVVAHGYVRFTADVDLIIDLDDGNVRAALEVFERLGYRPRPPVPLQEFAEPAARQRWIAEKGLRVFSLYSPRLADTEIDLFVESPLDFKTAHASALRVEVAPGVHSTFVSYQDLLALKKEAGRPQDLVDIERLRLARGEGTT